MNKQNRARVRALVGRTRTRPLRADDTVEEVRLYDPIGGWLGITGEEFADRIKHVNSKKLVLKINSPGGDVFEARTMVSAIRDYRKNGGHVTARITGLAASAATFIAISADEVEMEEGTFFMIHNSWGITIGNASEHEDTANLLRKVDASILNDYARKTGLAKDVIQEWMEEETWFTAEEAKEYGFADRVLSEEEEEDEEETVNNEEDEEEADEEEEDEEEEIGNKWDLSIFKNAPKSFKKSSKNRNQSTRNKVRTDATVAENARKLKMIELLG